MRLLVQARMAGCGDDLQLHRETAADREALSDTEPAHLVEIDPVLVLETGRAQARCRVAVELVGELVDAPRAGDVDKLRRNRGCVQEDGLG